MGEPRFRIVWMINVKNRVPSWRTTQQSGSERATNSEQLTLVHQWHRLSAPHLTSGSGTWIYPLLPPPTYPCWPLCSVFTSIFPRELSRKGKDETQISEFYLYQSPQLPLFTSCPCMPGQRLHFSGHHSSLPFQLVSLDSGPHSFMPGDYRSISILSRSPGGRPQLRHHVGIVPLPLWHLQWLKSRYLIMSIMVHPSLNPGDISTHSFHRLSTWLFFCPNADRALLPQNVLPRLHWPLKDNS